MEKEQKDGKLDKAFRRVQIADKIRLACLFIALLLVLFVFYGNKMAAQAAWYINCQGTVFAVLYVVLLLMLGVTIVKMILAARYNKLVREQKKQ